MRWLRLYTAQIRSSALGVGLDETLRLCLLIFSGEEELRNVERYARFRLTYD